MRKGKEKATCPTEKKAQQCSTQVRDPEGTAREGGSQREVQRTFKMLKKVWLDIRIERTDIYEGITIKGALR